MRHEADGRPCPDIPLEPLDGGSVDADDALMGVNVFTDARVEEETGGRYEGASSASEFSAVCRAYEIKTRSAKRVILTVIKLEIK